MSLLQLLSVSVWVHACLHGRVCAYEWDWRAGFSWFLSVSFLFHSFFCCFLVACEPLCDSQHWKIFVTIIRGESHEHILYFVLVRNHLYHMPFISCTVIVTLSLLLINLSQTDLHWCAELTRHQLPSGRRHHISAFCHSADQSASSFYTLHWSRQVATVYSTLLSLFIRSFFPFNHKLRNSDNSSQQFTRVENILDLLWKCI